MEVNVEWTRRQVLGIGDRIADVMIDFEAAFVTETISDEEDGASGL